MFTSLILLVLVAIAKGRRQNWIIPELCVIHALETEFLG